MKREGEEEGRARDGLWAELRLTLGASWKCATRYRRNRTLTNGGSLTDVRARQQKDYFMKYLPNVYLPWEPYA